MDNFIKISKNISIICKWKINNPLFSPENLNLITLEEGSVGRALAFMFPQGIKSDLVDLPPRNQK